MINASKTLSYRVNSTPFRCKAETQVSLQSLYPTTVPNYFAEIHAQFLRKLRGIKEGIHKGQHTDSDTASISPSEKRRGTQALSLSRT